MVFIYGLMIVLQHMFLITAMPLKSNDKVKYTYNQFMACYANSFSYLAQILLLVCRLLRTIHITAMAPESKVNKNLSYSFMFLIEVLCILYNNFQYDIDSKVKVKII